MTDAAVNEICNLLPKQTDDIKSKDCQLCQSHSCLEFAQKLLDGSEDLANCRSMHEISADNLGKIIELLRFHQRKIEDIETEKKKSFAEKMREEKENIVNRSILISEYEREYLSALNSIESGVKNLIQEGKDMESLLLFSEEMNKIIMIHEGLNMIYSIIYNFKNVLSHFDSERFKKINHDPIKLFEQFKNYQNKNEHEMNSIIIDNLRNIGYGRKHSAIPVMGIATLLDDKISRRLCKKSHDESPFFDDRFSLAVLC